MTAVQRPPRCERLPSFAWVRIADGADQAGIARGFEMVMEYKEAGISGCRATPR